MQQLPKCNVMGVRSSAVGEYLNPADVSKEGLHTVRAIDGLHYALCDYSKTPKLP